MAVLSSIKLQRICGCFAYQLVYINYSCKAENVNCHGTNTVSVTVRLSYSSQNIICSLNGNIANLQLPTTHAWKIASSWYILSSASNLHAHISSHQQRCFYCVCASCIDCEAGTKLLDTSLPLHAASRLQNVWRIHASRKEHTRK